MYILIKVSESLYVENVLDAMLAQLYYGVDCLIHVGIDGTITWSMYEEGKIPPRDHVHVRSLPLPVETFDMCDITTRSSDLRTLVMSLPDLYINPMKNELVIKAADMPARIEWIN